MKTGRQAVAYGTTLIIVTILTSVFIGIATLAFYYENDPLCTGQICRPDQIVPKLVADLFTSIPGFTGLFIVAVYSATLSSFSAFLSGAGTGQNLDLEQNLSCEIQSDLKTFNFRAVGRDS